MKNIILVLVLLINLHYVCLSQSTKSEIKNLKLTGFTKLTEEQQIKAIIENILQYFGDSFEFYDELKKNKFKIVESKGQKYLEITKDGTRSRNKSKKIKLKLNKESIDNHSRISIDLNELNKFTISSAKNNISNYGGSTDFVDIVERNNILIDKKILENEEIPGVYWKILHKAFATTYFINQEGERSPLFKNILGAVAIPYNNSTKLLTIDAGFNSSIYFNSDLSDVGGAINGYYGTYGPALGELFNPSDIIIGREYTASRNNIYPVYISDCNNFRIIKVNYVIDPSVPEMAHYDETSDMLFAKSNFPFGLSYFRHLSDPSKDKIWVSESNPLHPKLSCYNIAGNKTLSVKGYYYIETNQPYLFDEGTESRLAIYNDYFGAISFIDNKRNALVSCLLNNNGTASTIPYQDGELIIANDVNFFPIEHPLTSVSFYKTQMTLSSFPFMIVTSSSQFHLLRMNNSAHTHYLASTSLPLNSDEPFSDLLNTIKLDNIYDIFTLEKWTNTNGLRKYWFNAGIHSATLLQGCKNTLLNFRATFTNDCWLYLQAYRKNREGNWDIVKIKSLNGEPVNQFYVTKFQMAAWNQISDDLFLNFDLDLPIEDFALGGEVKLAMYIFPEYEYPDPVNQNRIYEEYPLNITPTCLPKPGGCPFLYVLDENNDYSPDNNILHKFEYDKSGLDIVDRYKLQIKPKLENNTIELFLIENENDDSFIDQVKIYAVDVPLGKKMALTEANDIVIFEDQDVLSSNDATHDNGMVLNIITDNVNYHRYTTPVEGFKNDNVIANFPVLENKEVKELGDNKSNTKKDKSGIQMKGYVQYAGNLTTPIESPKTEGGILTATNTFNDIVNAPFSRRESPSLIALPLFDETSEISNINIEWTSDFHLKYLGVVNLEYTGFNTNEVPLTYAGDISLSTESDVTHNILSLDNEYAQVNQDRFLKFDFNTSGLPDIPPNYYREFVIEATGHYTVGSERDKLSTIQSIPTIFKLYQNYPNPFNPKATIKFDLPKEVNVTIKVYDLLGKEVKILVNEFKKAGFHQVEFDASNYASGVYFYRIEAGSFVQAKKMVLVK